LNQKSIKLKNIGLVHSQYKKNSDAPRQGGDSISEIEISKDFEDGLKDIECFSYLHIIYWLHKSEDFSLLTHTPWDDELHGVFATRSPRRPNPIGYSVVKLVKRKKNILLVKNLDAIDGTPVIDIKPYIKKIDTKPGSNQGWLKKTKL